MGIGAFKDLFRSDEDIEMNTYDGDFDQESYDENEDEFFQDERYYENNNDKEALLVNGIRMDTQPKAQKRDYTIVLQKPDSFEDCLVIIDSMKNNNPIIISMEDVEDELGQRLIDLLSGAARAVNGELKRLSVHEEKIFLLAPSNVAIDDSMMQELSSSSKATFGKINYSSNRM
ncbi:MAG: cell division protein SepF [Lachnospirales bacterium]